MAVCGYLWRHFFFFSLGISCPYRQSEREERSAAFQTKEPITAGSLSALSTFSSDLYDECPCPSFNRLNAQRSWLFQSKFYDILLLSEWSGSLFMMLVISLDWMTCVWHCAQPFSYLFSIMHCIKIRAIYLFFFFFGGPQWATGGILFTWSGIKPGPSAVKVRCPNHCTTREFPTLISLNLSHLIPSSHQFWGAGHVSSPILWGERGSGRTLGWPSLACMERRALSPELVALHLVLFWQHHVYSASKN